MKVSLLLTLFTTLQVSANLFSQSSKLNLDVKDMPLMDVIRSIEQQSDYRFFFSDNYQELNNPVTLNMQGESINKVMASLLDNKSITYRLLDNNIVVITPLKAGQQQKVTGKIIDGTTSEPLIGVNIVVEGTTLGVVSDADGNFSIDVPNSNSVLVFSFIGYNTEKVAVNGQASLVVKLVPDITNLEEVVVVGYGEMRKRDVTGATSTLKANAIVNRPITRLDQALQGTTPGVAVGSNSGQPGKPVSVRIRGTNSITGVNDPLYVIDGYVGGNIESISLDDIEAMEILKDASATAIYGSRGSNGVVIITTKTGKEGKMKVDFNAWVSQASMPKYLDLMNAYQFANTVNTQYAANKQPLAFSDSQLASLKAAGDGTDWQREVTRTALVKDYQLKISGGSSAVRYMFSGDYLDQPGILINQNYKRGAIRANVDVKASEKLDLKFNLAGFQAKSHNTGYAGDLYDPFCLAFQWDPTTPIKDDKGNYNLHSQYGSIQINPVSEAANQNNDNTTNNFIGTGNLNYKIVKGLTFTTSVSFEGQYQHAPQLYNLLTNSGSGGSPRAFVDNTRYWSFQNSNYLTYQKTFGSHAITVTALYEQSQRENNTNHAQGNNLVTYVDGYYNLGLGGTQTISSGYWADGLQSFMGRVNYSYKEKYLLTASLRDDGSSHLTKKYSLFPSVALGWNVSKEHFFDNVNFISNLKIRASYGKTGNQAVGAYATIPTIVVAPPNHAGAYYFNGSAGQPSTATELNTPVSKDLKWETTSQYDAGLDAAFYENRLTLVVDLYKKDINDLLYDYSAPDYLGGGTYKKNIGSIENKGMEISIGGTPVSGSKLKWNTYFTISFNKNKIEDLGGLDNVIQNGVGSPQSGIAILKIGKPVGEFYGRQFLGTWKTSEAAEAHLFDLKPGDAKYVDVNNDHKYDDNDNVPIGNGNPKYTFGFTNDFSYGDFTLSFMFFGMQGNEIFSTAFPYTYGGLGDTKNATSVDAMNMWTAENETDFPVVGSSSNTLKTDRYVYDASFIKLKNLSLTYRLPKNLLSKVKVNNLEVYVSGQNIFCITKYKGYDPETTTAQNAMTQGLETGSIPNPKTFTIGFRSNF